MRKGATISKSAPKAVSTKQEAVLVEKRVPKCVIEAVVRESLGGRSTNKALATVPVPKGSLQRVQNSSERAGKENYGGDHSGEAERPSPVEAKLRRALEAASCRERVLLRDNAELHADLETCRGKQAKASERAAQALSNLEESEMRERRTNFALEKMQQDLDSAKQATTEARREARAQLSAMRERLSGVEEQFALKTMQAHAPLLRLRHASQRLRALARGMLEAPPEHASGAAGEVFWAEVLAGVDEAVAQLDECLTSSSSAAWQRGNQQHQLLLERHGAEGMGPAERARLRDAEVQAGVLRGLLEERERELGSARRQLNECLKELRKTTDALNGPRGCAAPEPRASHFDGAGKPRPQPSVDGQESGAVSRPRAPHCGGRGMLREEMAGSNEARGLQVVPADGQHRRRHRAGGHDTALRAGRGDVGQLQEDDECGRAVVQRGQEEEEEEVREHVAATVPSGEDAGTHAGAHAGTHAGAHAGTHAGTHAGAHAGTHAGAHAGAERRATVPNGEHGAPACAGRESGADRGKGYAHPGEGYAHPGEGDAHLAPPRPKRGRGPEGGAMVHAVRRTLSGDGAQEGVQGQRVRGYEQELQLLDNEMLELQRSLEKAAEWLA